jgi:hypothetical protein
MSSVKMELSLSTYLHEKAQESRQNEIQACFMFVAGAIFLIGGLLTNLKIPGDVAWFLIIPYHTDFNAGVVLGLSLVISGLFLMIFSVTIGFHYYRERKWFMEELRKAYENEIIKTNPTGQPSRSTSQKRKQPKIKVK